MPPKGFKLLHSGFYEQLRDLWEVVDVSIGADTGFELAVTIHDRCDREKRIVFPDQLSFRVHNELMLYDYWLAREAEKVSVGLLYSISSSDYLDECSTYTHPDDRLTHYLVAAIGLCVEVVTSKPPIMPAAWAEP